jgi:lipopolysaccharide export system permease protein
LIALLANEYFIPYTNQKAFDIKRTQVQHLPPYGVTKENDIWYRVQDGRIINVSLVDLEKQKLYKLAIFEFDRSNKLIRRWNAQQAQWTGSGWILQDGYLRTFEEGMLANVEQFAELKGDLNITPLELARAEREPEEMTFRELKAYIRKLSTSGIRTVRYKVDLQSKLSITFTSLVMSLFGASFALRSGSRSKSLLLGAGVSLLVGLGYWIVLALGISLGHSGKLPPFLAAWAGNLLFGAGGLFLLSRVRN